MFNQKEWIILPNNYKLITVKEPPRKMRSSTKTQGLDVRVENAHERKICSSTQTQDMDVIAESLVVYVVKDIETQTNEIRTSVATQVDGQKLSYHRMLLP